MSHDCVPGRVQLSIVTRHALYRLLCYNYVGVLMCNTAMPGAPHFLGKTWPPVFSGLSVKKSAVGVPYAIKSPSGILGAHREC